MLLGTGVGQQVGTTVVVTGEMQSDGGPQGVSLLMPHTSGVGSGSTLMTAPAMAQADAT